MFATLTVPRHTPPAAHERFRAEQGGVARESLVKEMFK